MGRFINADAFASTGQGLLGNNMFAYCLNNPISCSDVSGHAANWCNTVAIKEGSFVGGISGGGHVGGWITASTTTDLLWDAISKSYARSAYREYRSSNEVHHLVAKKSRNAALAAAILNETLFEGVENPHNKISIKTGLHRRLHTKLYYGIANSIVISAYLTGENETEQQNNVIQALCIIRAIVYILNESAPY